MSEAAHTRAWETSEAVFGVACLAGIALDWVWPLSLPAGWPRWVGLTVGVGLFGLGVGLIALTRRQMRLQGQPTAPGLPTSQLVTTGVFSISRNPLYLGVVVMLAGAGLATNVLWLWIMLLPAVIGCDYILIFPEERYLAARFGAAYASYTARVHRWLGRVG